MYVSRYEGFVDQTPNAVCLNGAQLGTLTFPEYVQQCLKDNDLRSVDNNFVYLQSRFTDAYDNSKSQFNNLLITYDNVINLTSGTNATTIDGDILSSTNKKKKLEDELKRYKSEAEAKNQSFLDSILQGRPKESLTPTLQDATLLIFWFGWILLAVSLIAIRWLSPDGGLRSGLFTIVLLLLVTLCMYAVLYKVA